MFREGRVHECYKMMEECRAAAKHGRQEESAEDGEPLREWRDGLTRCDWVLTPRGSFVYAERVWCRRCVDIGAVAVREERAGGCDGLSGCEGCCGVVWARL